MIQIQQTYEAGAILPYRVEIQLIYVNHYKQHQVINWLQETWGDRFTLTNQEGVWYVDANIPGLLEIWFKNESDAAMCTLKWV